MTTAPEPTPDHTRVPDDDAAGRLLAAMLATAGLSAQAAEPALAQPARG